MTVKQESKLPIDGQLCDSEALAYGKQDCQISKGHVTADDADVYWYQGTICKPSGPQGRVVRVAEVKAGEEAAAEPEPVGRGHRKKATVPWGGVAIWERHAWME